MIEALIGGRLQGEPEQRRGKSESMYVVAKVRAQDSDGDLIIINVIAFNADTGAALLELHDGDAVALSGSVTPKVWSDRQGNTRPALDMVAARVLSAHMVVGALV